jgi:hypothetical protein
MCLVTEDVLSDLHTRKQRAIDALDFEGARSLYTEIQNTIADRARLQIADISSTACQKLTDLQQSYRLRQHDLAEEKRCIDTRLYSQFQVLFEETRADHINQLINLEKERGLVLLEESEREIPAQIALLERAKQDAFDAHFEDAISHRQEARNIGQAELELRRRNVEEKYQQAKKELLFEQNAELDQITTMHEREVIRLKQEADDRDSRARSDFMLGVAQIRNEAEVQVRALKTVDVMKAEALARVKAKIDEMMKEFGDLPPVVPKLTRSEVMRLMSLCPTKAAMNAMPTEVPQSILARVHARTAKPTAPRMGARPVSTSSTGLMTRAYTAVGARFNGRHRRTRDSAN